MPVRVAPVESSAPQRTSDSIAFLFTAWQSTRRQKSQIEVKRAALLARLDDGLDGGGADVLHRVEPEADVALRHHEVVPGLVDVGRQHLDPHLLAA